MTHTPAPAEIETLRKIVAGRTCTEHDQRAAVAILDRLSPPEPEQPDEATVWTRKVLHAEYQITAYATGEMDDRAQFINARQVLSELIASKDAEADAKVKYAMDRLNEAHANKPDWERLWAEQTERAEKAESELAALRAENERVRDAFIKLLDATDRFNGICAHNKQPMARMQGNMILAVRNAYEVLGIGRLKAAECNPAGPGPWPGDPDHRETMPVGTAPVVEVTVDSGMDAEAVEQAELFWAQLPVNRKWISIPTHEKALVCHLLSTYRTEAEARGRREALEDMREKVCAHFRNWEGSSRGDAFGAVLSIIDDELKSMMTEGR